MKQITMEQAAETMQTLITLNVLRAAEVATWKITVLCYVVPQKLPMRSAKANEVIVKLWGGGTAPFDIVTGKFSAKPSGPWGVIPLQPIFTNAQGLVVIGDPAWVSDRAGTILYLSDGTYRVSALHSQWINPDGTVKEAGSGTLVNRYFLIANQIVMGVSEMEMEVPGRIMPATFTQPRRSLMRRQR